MLLQAPRRSAQRSLGTTASTASSMAPPSRMQRSGDQPCEQDMGQQRASGWGSVLVQ